MDEANITPDALILKYLTNNIDNGILTIAIIIYDNICTFSFPNAFITYIYIVVYEEIKK